MRPVHVLVPEGIDDPARPSGGNLYDRRICFGLADLGWRVDEHPIPGPWPAVDADAEQTLARVVAGLPDGSLLLVDGLIASAVPSVLVPAATRLRLVVLVHLPLGEGPAGDQVAEARVREGAVLAAARGVVCTSEWARDALLNLYRLPPGRVQVALPGVDPADLASGTAAGGNLLCVAAVTAHKGHDVLVEALAAIADLPWRCVCVGTLAREPGFVDRLRHRVDAAGIGDRICFPGPRTGPELQAVYAAADALVLPSRTETYGMVVTEALAQGLPVIATAVGGLPEALGRTATGRLPGLLVPPEDAPALAAALRRWLADPDLRRSLRAAAQERRRTLSDWTTTTARVDRVLQQVAA
nr:glycosyltransferase family 4 protein [uncultured Friedmanniella sp.]